MKNYIVTTYPELDNLSSFVHPKYHKFYSFMPINELFDLARNVLSKISELKINQVVVLESGVVPLAKICQLLAIQQNIAINWVYCKLPRNIEACLYQAIVYYYPDYHQHAQQIAKLSADISQHFVVKHPSLQELQEYVTKHFLNNSLINSLRNVMRGSSLVKILENQFIIFDEYLDSGKTLSNTIKFFHLFRDNLDYKILAYFSRFKDTTGEYITSLYNPNSEEECYDAGVYPFENRVDLIGYFYLVDNTVQKVFIQQLLDKNKSLDSSNTFFKLLDEMMRQHNLLSQVKGTSQIKPVADYIDFYHLQQFFVYLLERIANKDPKIIEFYYQLFDMYGPIWSPLPDEYHLDFLQTFISNEQKFTSLINGDIMSKYLLARKSLITNVAELCLSRYKTFWQKINNYPNEIYESK